MIAAVVVAATAVAVHSERHAGGDAGNVDSGTPAKAGSRAAGAPEGGSLPDLIRAPRAHLSDEVRRDIFAGPWSAAATPGKSAPPVTPKPTAPTFPYKYGGRLQVGTDALQVYLQKANELIPVAAGEMLDEVWRVDVVTADRIEVSFMPSGQRLSMLFASLTEDIGRPEGISSTPAADPPLAQLPAAPAAQTATGTQPLVVGAMGLPGIAPARASARGVATAGASADAASPSAAAGPGNSSPPPTGTLGDDAPKSGSMPVGPSQAGTSMPIGPVPSGAIPTSPGPAGKLGI